MKERPILFSAPMVRAILRDVGPKTQTRRVVKPQPMSVDEATHKTVEYSGSTEFLKKSLRCPYGQPGDRLWVRETFAKIAGQTQPWIETDYRATYTHGNRLGDTLGIKKRWTPAIHMPRVASRITLEVTRVRVERLQDISEADALAEGIGRLHDGGYGLPAGEHYHYTDPRQSYFSLWEAINGAGTVEANPWVWVVEFKRLEGDAA